MRDIPDGGKRIPQCENQLQRQSSQLKDLEDTVNDLFSRLDPIINSFISTTAQPTSKKEDIKQENLVGLALRLSENNDCILSQISRIEL